MAGGAGSAHGTGGMATKITAAELCMDAGIPMMVANGDKQGLLYDIVDGKRKLELCSTRTLTYTVGRDDSARRF